MEKNFKKTYFIANSVLDNRTAATRIIAITVASRKRSRQPVAQTPAAGRRVLFREASQITVGTTGNKNRRFQGDASMG